MGDFKKRIESESQCISRTTNQNLKCRDCLFRLDDSKILGNTSRCQEYPLKPNQVLKGGDCTKYKKGD